MIRLPPFERTHRCQPVLEDRYDTAWQRQEHRDFHADAARRLDGKRHHQRSEIRTLAGKFSGARQGKVLLFAPAEPRTCRINLLAEVRAEREHLVGDAERLAHLLLDIDGSEVGEDAFWRLAAARLVQAKAFSL